MASQDEQDDPSSDDDEPDPYDELKACIPEGFDECCDHGTLKGWYKSLMASYDQIIAENAKLKTQAHEKEQLHLFNINLKLSEIQHITEERDAFIAKKKLIKEFTAFKEARDETMENPSEVDEARQYAQSDLTDFLNDIFTGREQDECSVAMRFFIAPPMCLHVGGS